MSLQDTSFRILAENSVEGISIVAKGGVLIFANRAFHELHGYDHSQNEMLGMTYIGQIIDESPYTLPEILDSLKAGKAISGGSRHRRKDGSTFPVAFTSFPLVATGNDLELTATFIRDISLQKELERLENRQKQELIVINQSLAKEIEERKRIEAELLIFQQLAERSNDAITIINLEGYLLYANPAAHHLYGYDSNRQEMLGLHYRDYNNMDEVESKNIASQSLAALKAGQPFRTELTRKRKDGSHFLAAVSTFSLDTQASKVATIIQDITAKRETENEREALIKELLAAKRLAEENSRLKSEFLSTMSHELRTPLNAIEGFTGILQSKMGGTDYNEKTDNFLKRIRANSQRLLQLINDFLDLSRVESGRLELANQAFSPTKLAKNWRDEIGVLADKKGLNFELNIDSSLPEILYGDNEAISKVVINLLSNAIKFTERGTVRLKLAKDGSSWSIAVEDTGIGIPQHAREFIFEEFRQVDQSSKRKYGGTGLGLAIVQKYTRSMGGTVSVQSELNNGSKFTVTLPIKTSIN